MPAIRIVHNKDGVPQRQRPEPLGVLVTEAQRIMLALLSVKWKRSMTKILSEWIEGAWTDEKMTRSAAEELFAKGMAQDRRRKAYDLDAPGMFYEAESNGTTRAQRANAPYTIKEHVGILYRIAKGTATPEEEELAQDRELLRRELEARAFGTKLPPPHETAQVVPDSGAANFPFGKPFPVEVRDAVVSHVVEKLRTEPTAVETPAHEWRKELKGHFVDDPDADSQPAACKNAEDAPPPECSVCGESDPEFLDENGVCAWYPQEWHREQEEAQKARTAQPDVEEGQEEHDDACAGCVHCEGEEL